MSRFEGKTALIAGGAQGIGAAIARAFAFAGASVVIGDISDEAGRALKAEIAAAGGESLFVHLDVTSEPDWQGAIERALQRYGRLGLLVNNAGTEPAPPPVRPRTGAAVGPPIPLSPPRPV